MAFNYPRNVRYFCMKCATCCGDTETRDRHILLLKPEAERIVDATAKRVEEFAHKLEGHAPYVYEMMKTVNEGKCVFLKNKRCTIYALRPLVCRFYPFELKTAEAGKHEFFYTSECRGIGAGNQLTEEYFENLLKQLPTRNRRGKQLQRQ